MPLDIACGAYPRIYVLLHRFRMRRCAAACQASMQREEAMDDPGGEAPQIAGEGALPARRHAQIVEFINQERQATAAVLMNRFGVSRDTIRRDLTLLEERGLLVRTHGGAVARGELVTSITTLSSRMDAQTNAKMRIARQTAALLRDGETVALNGGSTTTYLAAELGERRLLTLVTNNLRIPLAVPERSLRNLYLIGGTWLSGPQVTVGSIGFAHIAGVRADTAIIGVTALSAEGFSIGTLEEALASKAMMDLSRRVVLVADHTKFNRNAFALVAPLRAAQMLVTDRPPSGELAGALAEAEVQVVVSG